MIVTIKSDNQLSEEYFVKTERIKDMEKEVRSRCVRLYYDYKAQSQVEFDMIAKILHKSYLHMNILHIYSSQLPEM